MIQQKIDRNILAKLSRILFIIGVAKFDSYKNK